MSFWKNRLKQFNVPYKMTKRFNLVPSDMVKIPSIKESKIRMECVLESHMPIKSEGKIVADLIIGRVLKFHIDDTVYQNGKIDYNAFNPISRLAGPNYSKIGEVITLERPK